MLGSIPILYNHDFGDLRPPTHPPPAVLPLLHAHAPRRSGVVRAGEAAQDAEEGPPRPELDEAGEAGRSAARKLDDDEEAHAQ